MTTAERSHEQKIAQTDRRLVASRYRLLERVGHGRLGDIYEADDSEHLDLAVGRRVAIQLLHASISRNGGLLKKLKLGYNVLRAARHPNIVPFSDFDHDEKVGYLVMEFLEGASLRVILENSATLPLDEVVPVIRAVGDALQFLHAKSIVHRRVTAENVFVTEDLEVRLLDVVPLNSAISITDAVPSGEPFGRCDATDDIYGLACLTYEMLAGTHPFNFHTLAEARHAGLRPARIESLPEIQWNALCHALAFESEQRTPTIANFLREFGVKATERLRPSEDATGAIQIARREDAPAPPKAKRTRWVPSVVLMMVLAGLGAWYFYGQPRDDVARLIASVDSYLDDSAPAPSSNTEFANIPPAIVTEPDAEDVVISEVTVPATEEATPEPADEQLAIAETLAPRSESRPELIRSVINISEDDGAVRIASPYPEIAAGQIFWWTADETAAAEIDYIPTEEPIVGFASGEESEMLYIPLVDDGLPEAQEAFYVYLGRHNAQLGRLETIASIRVEINDDDW